MIVLYVLELVSGLASLEPPAKMSTGHFILLIAKQLASKLAPNSSPLFTN